MCPARHHQPSAMLAAIKGLSRHKRHLPTHGGRVSGLLTRDTSAPHAGPPIYSTVRLTAAARGGVLRPSGRGTSVRRDGSPLPCRGRRTGNRTRMSPPSSRRLCLCEAFAPAEKRPCRILATCGAPRGARRNFLRRAQGCGPPARHGAASPALSVKKWPIDTNRKSVQIRGAHVAAGTNRRIRRHDPTAPTGF